MIKKIDIASYGLFSEFLWATILGGPAEFKKYNVIYGRNYSGKTTLSRIFHCLERGQANADYPHGQFTITFEDGSTITPEQLSTLPDTLKVRVFNDDFVKENLNWFHRPDGSIQPFTVLGKENVELQARISELQSKLGDASSSLTVLGKLESAKTQQAEAQRKLDDRRNSLNESLRNKAREIKEHATVFGVPTYHITTIRGDLSSVSATDVLSTADKEECERILRDATLPVLNEPSSISLQFDRLLSKTKSLVSRAVSPTQQIDDLATSAPLQEWARNGISLHKGVKESCGFCGGSIPDDRWTKLEEHFNADSEDLRAEIKIALRLIADESRMVNAALPIRRDQLYSAQHSEFDSLIQSWQEAVKSYDEGLQSLESLLQTRESDIFTAIGIPDIKDDSGTLGEIHEKLRKLVIENNEIGSTLGTHQTNARNKLRLSEVATYGSAIDYPARQQKISELENERQSLHERTSQLDAQRQEIEMEISSLEDQLKDSGHGAELVNKYLRDHFGHAGLRLVSTDDGTGTKFCIYRGDAEAKNLSTGECSLIGFCYFMAKLRDDLSENLIVFIDDPISSLDTGHIYFIFSMIKGQLTSDGCCRQLIMSTHNFDFLKYLTSFRNVPGVKNQLSFFMTERKMKGVDPRCYLRVMPKYLSNFVSEFNYLFSEIYQFYSDGVTDGINDINETYNSFYNLPNNLRKFLEFYLFYKFPNNAGLSNLGKLFGDQDSAFVNRIINEGSHLNFIERAWHPFDIPEMERCVRIVIDKIKETDRPQFNELVESLAT